MVMVMADWTNFSWSDNTKDVLIFITACKETSRSETAVGTDSFTSLQSEKQGEKNLSSVATLPSPNSSGRESQTNPWPGFLHYSCLSTVQKIGPPAGVVVQLDLQLCQHQVEVGRDTNTKCLGVVRNKKDSMSTTGCLLFT